MLLAVTGKPIAHSASPDLHRAGMLALGICGASVRLISDSAKEALQLARDLGVTGLNVTAPFKEQMVSLLDELSSEAKTLQAVNTVLFNGNKTVGFNTDVYGVKESLKSQLNESIDGIKAVVLGAGGAAKAACMALDELNVEITVLNRSKDKAAILASKFEAKSYSFDESAHKESILGAKVIINCLSTLERPFNFGLLNNKHIILDAHYKTESDISKEARGAGAIVISGFDWLLNQSRESQHIFFSTAPDLKKLKAGISSRKKKSLALIGLMGSGKSEVGKELASKLDLNFIDLDKQIENNTKKSIKEIFVEQGEPFFRATESSHLQSLDHRIPHVLSCGGGIVLDPQNRNFLRNNYQVIWLWAKPESLQARFEDVSTRPILERGNVKQRLQELLLERKDLYAKSSDLVISTDDRSKAQVIQRIYEELNHV